MNCPKCGGKCKVVQTHKSTEAKIEKVYVEAGLGKKEKKSLSDYEMVEKNVVNSIPIVRRKQHCPNCDCYFWTEENFKCYTEATTKKTMMESLLDKFNEVSKDFDKTEGLVYSNKPIDKLPPIKLDIHIGRK